MQELASRNAVQKNEMHTKPQWNIKFQATEWTGPGGPKRGGEVGTTETEKCATNFLKQKKIHKLFYKRKANGREKKRHTK